MRTFHDLKVNEKDGKIRLTLRNRDGSVALRDVTAEVSSEVVQQGDRWSAAAANKLLRLDENGAPVLAIQPKEVGGLTRCTHRKSGSVHEISGEGEDLRFVASADFAAGDRFTLNGRAVSVRTLSGEALWPGYFKSGSVVLCHKDGDVLTFSGGGGLSSADKETVKAFLAVGHSVMGGQVQGSYTSDATAGESDILTGCVAYAKGRRLEGRIPRKQAQIYRPGTQDQIIGAGQYLAQNQTIQGDGALVSSNIRSGASIFGVAGSAPVREFSAACSIYSHYDPDWLSMNLNDRFGDFTLEQDSGYEAKLTVNRAGIYDIIAAAKGNVQILPKSGAALGERVWLSAGAAFYIGPKGGGDWGNLSFCALRRE